MEKLIKLSHKIINDEYTKFVYDSFDIQNRDETNVVIENNIDIDVDDDVFNIGCIYGGSGSGKTTLLRQFGEIKESTFDNAKSLISNFTFTTPREAALLLSSIGLSSVPTWLRPYDKLSNGEQYRARLAYLIGIATQDEIVLVDEFTSVVDRDVACAMSNALSKYVRRVNKRIIVASCHFDIMEWLQPDWIYSPLKRRLEKRADLPRQTRPEIKLSIFRSRYDCWRLFKSHHYLSEDLNKTAKCFLTMWGDKPVGFIAVLPFPHGSLKNAFRISRIVILPDYQGIGIGNKILDYVSSLYKTLGCRMYIKTSNPALWSHNERSGKWRFCSEINNVEKIKAVNEKLRREHHEETRTNIDPMKLHKESVTKSFEYIGPVSTDSTDIIKFDIAAYRDVAQNQINLFE